MALDVDLPLVVSEFLELQGKSDNHVGNCPFHSEKTDSFNVWENTAYCFGCGWQGDAVDFIQHYYKEHKGEEINFKKALEIISNITNTPVEELKTSLDQQPEKKPQNKQLVPAMPIEAQKAFVKDKTYRSNDYRGIKNKYHKFYNHLFKLDGQKNVIATYYPETNDLKEVTGYKCRNHPKDFSKGKVGNTGLKSQLSGQFKFKGGGKYVLLVGGEEDKVAAFQMLHEYQQNKNQEGYAPTPVVSPTTGESSAVKQVAAQYDWLNTFENILIGMDSDEAGMAATKKICEVLPKEKIKIVTWSGKDPNEMLNKKMQKQFISDFWNAREYVPSGVMTSHQADEQMVTELAREKLPLPSFLKPLEELFAGGIPLGYIVNLIAGTGIGKTTIVNEVVRYWIYNSPYKIGIMSLELNAGQYMVNMLSREMGKKISLIKDPQDAVNFINSPVALKAREKLCDDESGEPRFVLLDDREGTLEHVKGQIEILIKKYDCKVIIIDPIQDLFEGVDMDTQNGFVRWMKATVKRGVTIIPVCHIRKSVVSTDKEGKRIVRQLTEDDVHGISSIVKSAGANVFFTRDKYAEDPIERNTTKVELGKCRWTGLTGPAGTIYYENLKHTLYNFDTYFSEHGEGGKSPPQYQEEKKGV